MGKIETGKKKGDGKDGRIEKGEWKREIERREETKRGDEQRRCEEWEEMIKSRPSPVLASSRMQAGKTNIT